MCSQDSYTLRNESEAVKRVDPKMKRLVYLALDLILIKDQAVLYHHRLDRISL